MEKFYANSEEKYLKGVLLYASPAVGGDSVGLFYDAEGTLPAHNSDHDWEDLFLKGLIRVRFMGEHSGTRNFYAPYRLLADSEGVSLDAGTNFGANFFADEEQSEPEPFVPIGPDLH